MEPRAQILKSGLFNEAVYSRQCFLNGEAVGDPIRHYLAEGGGRDLNPHQLFDSAYYRGQCGSIPPAMSPLEHYLRHGKRLSPHPLFDPGHYVSRSPKAASTPVSLLEHYLTSWRTERCSPHPLLDVNWYLQRYPDV